MSARTRTHRRGAALVVDPEPGPPYGDLYTIELQQKSGEWKDYMPHGHLYEIDDDYARDMAAAVAYDEHVPLRKVRVRKWAQEKAS